MNSMISKAILITYAKMGVRIDMMDNTDTGIIFLFTVPKNSYHKDANGIEMSGKHLASRVKHTLEEMGIVFADCRYGIRDEHWDEAKAEHNKNLALEAAVNYKKWQTDNF